MAIESFPQGVASAVRIIVSEDRADHIDMNFGCPVPKVTRKGGGSALPWKKDLFASIVHAAVDAANGRVPVSVKMSFARGSSPPDRQLAKCPSSLSCAWECSCIWKLSF